MSFLNYIESGGDRGSTHSTHDRRHLSPCRVSLRVDPEVIRSRGKVTSVWVGVGVPNLSTGPRGSHVAFLVLNLGFRQTGFPVRAMSKDHDSNSLFS